MRFVSNCTWFLSVGALTGILASSAFAEPITTCVPMAEERKFDCRVILDEKADKEATVEAVVSMSMPSMPMAHNVPPAELVEDEDQRGHYTFDIELPMLGDWIVTYDVNAPRRDRFRNRLMFVEGQPATSDDATSHDHDVMEADGDRDQPGHDHALQQYSCQALQR